VNPYQVVPPSSVTKVKKSTLAAVVVIVGADPPAQSTLVGQVTVLDPVPSCICLSVNEPIVPVAGGLLNV